MKTDQQITEHAPADLVRCLDLLGEISDIIDKYVGDHPSQKDAIEVDAGQAHDTISKAAFDISGIIGYAVLAKVYYKK